MQLNFHQFNGGNGYPLLILHGLFGNQDNWYPQAQILGTRRWVITADLRNHGRSFHNERMDYPAMAADVQQLLQHLQLSQVDLLGHSMGGKVAMQLAFNQPQLIRSLVVADIAPVAYRSRHNVMLEAMVAINLGHLKSRNQAHQLLARAVPDIKLRQFLLKSLYRCATGAFAWRFNLAAITTNYSQISQAPSGTAYIGPCLIIQGTESDYIQTQHKEIFSTLLPTAQLKQMIGCGHWLHAEKPALFCQLVDHFLQTL